MNSLDSKIPRKKSLFFNLNDSSLGRHVNAASRKSLENSSVFYYKTENPFEAKISFQAL